MSDLFVYYGKSNTKYPAVECICAICGKPFLKGIRWLSRTPVHICSKECNLKYRAVKRQEDQNQRLIAWQAQNNRCANCGKVMTEFYGSGKFCSRSCANSRNHSDITKNKISKTLDMLYNDSLFESVSECVPIQQTKQARIKYESSPKICIVCGNSIAYNKRHRQTCSDDCYKLLVASKAKINGLGGLTDGCGNYSKHGKYKGIKCDSTYELVFLIYCLDHNISIIRNTKYFSYIFDGKERKYYPDFYLPEANLYVELKGYKDARVDLKLQAVKNSGNNIAIYYKQDLLPCFEFVGGAYNKKAHPNYNNLEELYDKK
jgi:predicted nucleic acid-binding Zn ribbon protein